MNVLEEQSLRSGDNLDHLLRAYFQAEMPEPWPALKAPAAVKKIVPGRPARPVRKAGRGLWRSRLALAASIVLLIAGLVLLGGKMHDTGVPTPFDPNGSAMRPHDLPGNNHPLPGQPRSAHPARA